MKDKQAPTASATYSIPLLSPLLHHLAMPVIVFWRYHFGFSYLGRKRIFLASIWACMLLTYIVWNTPDLKDKYGSLAVFFCMSSALYLFHLVSSFRGELSKSGKHDQYSGDSHLSRLWIVFLARKKHLIHCAVEPIFTCIIGIILTQTKASQALGKFLIFVAVCLLVKESLNAWLTLRRGKRHSDLTSDITEEYPEANSEVPPIGTTTRRPKTKRQRDVSELLTIDPEEWKHAQTLRLMPPYTLAAALENYRILIKQAHPDLHSGNTDATAHTQNLNEAMEYFRQRLKF